ncbi:glycosyl transferase family 2 [Dysgonomonas alginatilytica]|uniref:Glycosyl transferase family 2 n=1 Tax=Dysgonomonas alginatilytica TaxID=1605892 RepID=A0A2V3PNB7_9BACT|nr:glycosyltransferase [Dysgonomonas alginatilytica]PXV62538.1 glycosyl transferase family 2 [Dysgonomonas alginatilytica]
MYNQELVTIIVPVYNVEQYLPKCLDSIISQIYKNIEIILINDGSTDRSLAICEEYKEKDNRITIFNQKNQGLSSARNVGLDNAKGDFISFIDSDDFVAADFISELYTLLKDTDSDIVQCDYIQVEEDDAVFIPKSSSFRTEEFSAYEYLQRLYSKKIYPRNVVVWNKLYHKNIWDNIRFPLGKLNEDEAVVHYIYDRATKITVSSKILYFYLKRSGSIMNVSPDMEIKRYLHYLETLTQRSDFFELKGYSELKEETLAQKGKLVRRIYKKNKKLDSSLVNYDLLICNYNRLVYDALDENIKLYLKNRYIKLKLKVRLLYIYLKLKYKGNLSHSIE